MMPKDWQHSNLKIGVLIVLTTIIDIAVGYFLIVFGQAALKWVGVNEFTSWIFVLIFCGWIFGGWFLIFRELDWRLG